MDDKSVFLPGGRDGAKERGVGGEGGAVLLGAWMESGALGQRSTADNTLYENDTKVISLRVPPRLQQTNARGWNQQIAMGFAAGGLRESPNRVDEADRLHPRSADAADPVYAKATREMRPEATQRQRKTKREEGRIPKMHGCGREISN
ncbi:hypothetical protein B0H14DRAFT_2555775 [Mycena olivaceomarginata]|nr:hypothetical protein B0H14DRAFT_2555775 [Mycena olivaceomarginata]